VLHVLPESPERTHHNNFYDQALHELNDCTMQHVFKKKYLLGWIGIILFTQELSAQSMLTGLGGNDMVKNAAKQAIKLRKTDTLFSPASVWLPFVDDFSSYTVYPDTALWANKQGFVNQSFAFNPPSIGCLTLDVVDEKGKIYAHAQESPFGADTVLSRPIRMDSVRISPVLHAELTSDDSVYFSFYYQPGGGKGQPWEGLGDAPDAADSLVLEFGYQTDNPVFLYYIYDTVYVFESFKTGDTIKSPCDTTLFIIADRDYELFDSVVVPCDSVCAMETVWNWIWSSQGMTLTQFYDTFHTDFRQVLIPITDPQYFNAHFQFRFRNYGSLGTGIAARQGNGDFWNIDYIRLANNRTWHDTAVNDLTIVENPSSILQKYTAMPWQHFIAQPTAELKSKFTLKLSNLYHSTKNSMYRYVIEDELQNTICSYSGGNQNIDPFTTGGYQMAAVHANPDLNPITYPSAALDSVLMTVKHIFQDQGSGDVNRYNDTVVYRQKFYNYFAYDDGTPESGYVIIPPSGKGTTALAVAFQLQKTDTVQAVEMYFNNVLHNAADYDFDLTIWSDNGNKPGQEIYKQRVEQHFSPEIYGFQRFDLEEPVVVNGRIYIGYQTARDQFLNMGFDRNNIAAPYFYQTNGGTWYEDFWAGVPMLRLLVGKEIPKNYIRRTNHDFGFHLYPNPAKDRLQLQIENEDDAADYILSLYSSMGQLLYRAPFDSEIHLFNYTTGVYVLHLTHVPTGKTAVKKFVIIR
jgi:hypothetical protein